MKTKRKRISIISRESDSRTLDIAMLEDELIRRGCEVRALSKLLTKDKSLKALGYAGHVLKQEAAILASDVVVLDTYIIPASMLPHRKGTKVVQMWHALGAIKKFGWQTVGKEGGSSEKTARLMKMHNGYDYVVCASIDYIKSVASGDRHEETLERILKVYPQLRNDKKTILYAPTFRRGKAVEVQKLIDALGPDKYNIVVKLHPLYRGEAAGTEGKFDTVIFDEAFSSNDWLAKVDVIISDYSSFVIESSLADKPLYIYAYDLEEYMDNTGLNIDFDKEPIAPYVFRDAETLAEAINKGGYDLASLRAFRDRYIDINTDNCTAALADFIESL